MKLARHHNRIFVNDFHITFRLYPLDANRSLNLSHDEKWEEIKEKQVLSHLLELTKVFDFSDELGRYTNWF